MGGGRPADEATPKTDFASGAGVFAPEGEGRSGTAEQVVLQVIRALYEGRYAPGQKLLESDLSQRFGIGRGTVREALRRLEAEGIVTAALNRGASIRMFSRRAVTGLLEVTAELAALAARLAAERVGSGHDVAPLDRALAELQNAIEARSPYDLSRARYGFYRVLAETTGNQELGRILVRNDMAIVRTQFRAAFSLESEAERVAHYGVVVRHVANGNPSGAERAMRAAAQNVLRDIGKLPDHLFASDAP